MKKLILCALAAAVVVQIWGTISWMILPWHELDFRQFSNDENIATVLRNELQGSGLYTIPNMDPSVHENEAAMTEWNNKARQGPFAFISVRAEGIAPGMGLPMSLGFLLNVIIGGLLLWLVRNTSITSLKGRTIFIAVAGTLGGLYVHFSNLIWWHFPFLYSLVGVVDMFITWGLAGFAIVKISDWLDAKKAV